jgi:hypothetical protein
MVVAAMPSPLPLSQRERGFGCKYKRFPSPFRERG